MNQKGKSSVDPKEAERQARFDRRYRLLELKERREDRALKQRELELAQGRGIRFTSAQATVAGAALAVLSAILGGLIQSFSARDVEAGRNASQIAIQELKVRGDIALEKQKQDAAERLDRAKFETTLILKATEAPRREDQIRNLKFFLAADFISDPKNKIANMSEDAYPSSPPPTTEKAKTPADLYRDSMAAVGLISVTGMETNGTTIQLQGTCFVVSKDGYALTAAHLFPDTLQSRKIEVALRSKDSPRLPAQMVKIDRELNIALIKLSGNTGFAPITVSREQLQTADPVFALGYPTGLDSAIASGIVTSLNEDAGKIALSTALNAGFAGSPIFGKSGEVVAIVIGNRQDLSGAVAVPISFARSLLSTVGFQ
ncbi:serine protease [Bradyrhizobium arachidis]|uniref:S1 family peptidase n=1 Tax=Bradyrhizobium arachidis TaxID=858423 RepID=UPI0021634B82|nr:serine protease [Bradyrhizobium arachidis]UVO28171.1 serine protease [Bradyrhizobium arachidis]